MTEGVRMTKILRPDKALGPAWLVVSSSDFPAGFPATPLNGRRPANMLSRERARLPQSFKTMSGLQRPP